MTALEKFNLVKRACVEQRVCELKYKDERIARCIHPLGICLNFNRGLVIVFCWEENTTPLKKAYSNVSNFPIEDCHSIKILEKKFQVWPDFVAEAKFCQDWLFHI